MLLKLANHIPSRDIEPHALEMRRMDDGSIEMIAISNALRIGAQEITFSRNASGWALVAQKQGEDRIRAAARGWSDLLWRGRSRRWQRRLWGQWSAGAASRISAVGPEIRDAVAIGLHQARFNLRRDRKWGSTTFPDPATF